jgi:transposase
MQTQRGLSKDSTLTKFVLGAHPIIEQFIEMLQIREIIGAYVRTDKRMKLDDDKALTLLIHNILTTPNALYEMEDWLRPLDAEKVGLAPEETAYIQDDKIGRALAKFYDSRHKDVFFRLALRAIKIFTLDCSQIHHDTTTVTFAGKYVGWSARELLGFGHNKDHRPDLKQLVLGLNVTADGAVPISHRIYAGNQTDDRLHPTNHKALQKLLQRADFIYVADCKLATEENLQKIAAWHGLFVSVMPRSWKEDERFRNQVRQGMVAWRHILSRKNNRKPESQVDRYYVAQGDYKTSHGYRLHWIRSTQKATQDAETRERQIQQTLDELRSIQTKINSYNLKTRKQIKQRVETILKQKGGQTLIQYEIHATREYKRTYQRKGRPGKDSPSKITWKQVYSLSFGVDKHAVGVAEKTDGVFPLITNLDPKTHSPKKVLEIYKFQPFIEKRYSQIKTYQEIAPVYLKKPERVVAFLHMHVMALMVAALVERKLRLAMRKKGITSLPIYPEKRACPSPTIFDIVRLFKNVERYEVTTGDQTMIFPAELSRTQKEVLKLLEVPVAAYH